MYEATVVENVDSQSDLYRKEVFGYDFFLGLIYSPVCVLKKFDSFKEVCNEINDSDFGLQAGVYTSNLNKAFYAFNNLHVGGVVINDIPSARVDSQPVKKY